MSTTTTTNPFDGSPITIHADRLNVMWSLGYTNGYARVLELRKRPSYAQTPVNLAAMVEFIHAFGIEAKARKWSGFIWVAPGNQLLIISQEKKKLDSGSIIQFIDGGWAERVNCIIGGERTPVIVVGDEVLLKSLPVNHVGSRLYDGGLLVGEAMIPFGATGWGY